MGSFEGAQGSVFVLVLAWVASGCESTSGHPPATAHGKTPPSAQENAGAPSFVAAPPCPSGYQVDRTATDARLGLQTTINSPAPHEYECEVLFWSSPGCRKSLLRAPNCSHVPSLEEVQDVGALKRPVRLPSGEEVRLFQIPTARGGNLTEAIDYWVVLIREGHDAWASEQFTLEQIDHAEISHGRLVIEEHPGTTWEGARYEFTYGSTTRTPLPQLPSHVTSTRDIIEDGSYEGSYGYTRWRPLLRLRGKDIIIDHIGRCSEPNYHEVPIRAALRIDTYSDGREEVTCLALTPRE